MMKKLIMLGLAVLGLLTSCSNDELVMVNDSNAIAFSTQVNKSTRGVKHDITNSTINNFYVYGYTALSETSSDWTILSNDEKVTGSGTDEDGNWSYSNIQYWKKDLNYRFHAITSSSDSWVERHWTFEPYSTTDGDNTTYDYSKGKITFENISSNKCNNEDLIYSYSKATGSENYNQKVGLSFKHLLSRVKFRFVASGDATVNPSNARYTISDVKMNGAYMKGSIIVDYDEISGDVESSNSVDVRKWDVSGSDNTAKNVEIGSAIYKVNNASTQAKLDEKKLPQYKYTYDKLNNKGATYSISVNNYYFGPDGDYIEAETDHTYLIPAAVKYGDYSITFKASYLSTVNGYNGDGLSEDSPLEGTLVHVTGTANLPEVDMKKGYSYVYVIEVNAKEFEDIDPNYPDDTLKPIEFNVTDVLTYKTDDMDLEDDDEETNESYKLPEQKTIGEITDLTKVGKYDYAMSDGSFVSRYRTLTEEQQDECVGIVYWTKRETEGNATLDTDKVLMKNYSACTHGLIISLKDFESKYNYVWQDLYEENIEDVYEVFQKDNETYGNKPYVPIKYLPDENDVINSIYGYNNTEVLKAYNETATYTIKPIVELDEAISNGDLINVDGFSPWYIPSIKELALLAYDGLVSYGTHYDNSSIESLNKAFSKLRSTDYDILEDGVNGICSSTYITKNAIYSFYPGEAEICGIFCYDETVKTRPICAF